MNIKTLSELTMRMDAHSEKCNKEFKNIKMKQIELKNIITRIKKKKNTKKESMVD